MAALRALLGMSALLVTISFVSGFVLWSLNHSSILARSNVDPSAVMTGSFMISRDIGQKKCSRYEAMSTSCGGEGERGSGGEGGGSEE